jgi:hypothetical protein
MRFCLNPVTEVRLPLLLGISFISPFNIIGSLLHQTELARKILIQEKPDNPLVHTVVLEFVLLCLGALLCGRPHETTVSGIVSRIGSG